MPSSASTHPVPSGCSGGRLGSPSRESSVLDGPGTHGGDSDFEAALPPITRRVLPRDGLIVHHSSPRSDHQLESRMRETRLSGSEGGGAYALPTPIRDERPFGLTAGPKCSLRSSGKARRRSEENMRSKPKTPLFSMQISDEPSNLLILNDVSMLSQHIIDVKWFIQKLACFFGRPFQGTHQMLDSTKLVCGYPVIILMHSGLARANLTAGLCGLDALRTTTSSRRLGAIRRQDFSPYQRLGLT